MVTLCAKEPNGMSFSSSWCVTVVEWTTTRPTGHVQRIIIVARSRIRARVFMQKLLCKLPQEDTIPDDVSMLNTIKLPDSGDVTSFVGVE